MKDGAKPRDLEDRTFQFAESVRTFVKELPRTVSNSEDVRQLVRASGSVAANWIEADEALRKKDFLMRAKICRWDLELLEQYNENQSPWIRSNSGHRHQTRAFVL